MKRRKRKCDLNFWSCLNIHPFKPGVNFMLFFGSPSADQPDWGYWNLCPGPTPNLRALKHTAGRYLPNPSPRVFAKEMSFLSRKDVGEVLGKILKCYGLLKTYGYSPTWSTWNETPPGAGCPPFLSMLHCLGNLKDMIAIHFYLVL